MWFVGFVFLLGLTVGLISIIYPLRFIRIESRGTGLRVVAASLIFFCVAGAMVGPPQERAVPFGMLFFFVLVAGLVSVIYPLRPLYILSRAIAVRVVGGSLAMLFVCFVFLVHSLPPSTRQQQALAASEAPARSVRSDPAENSVQEVREAVERIENEAKAAEASANVHALAAKREFDQADFDADVARQNLRNVARESEDKWKRDQADVDRANYGVNVAQRRLDDLQREHLNELERKAAEARQRGDGYNR
jgi:hypothetical protein